MYTKKLKDIYIWNPRVKNTMKKEKRDSEKGKCMEKALYWLGDIYTVKVRRFRLKLFSRLNGFKDECV